MEEMHRTHKEPAWGWLGAMAAALDGPRRRGKTPSSAPCPGGREALGRLAL